MSGDGLNSSLNAEVITLCYTVTHKIAFFKSCNSSNVTLIEHLKYNAVIFWGKKWLIRTLLSDF